MIQTKLYAVIKKKKEFVCNIEFISTKVIKDQLKHKFDETL